MAGPGPRLIAGGDIMLGEHPLMVGRGVLTSIVRDRAFDPFAGISRVLASADVVFANLECALVDLPPGTPVERRDCVGPVRGLYLIRDAGFNVLNIANNHIEQHGAEPLQRTASALAGQGIAVAGFRAADGAGCRPADIEAGGVQIRFLGYSLRPRQHFTRQPLYAEGNTQAMLDDVRAGAAACRQVIVSLHWGDEFVDRPSRTQVELGRALIDAGACLVLGHHPHVLQGWETRGRGVIVYSLGNLVFDMPWHPALRRSALFSCRLDGEGVSDPAWFPLMLNSHHSPCLATGKEAQRIETFLASARKDLEAGNGPLAPPEGADYARLVRRGLARNRATSYGYFLRNAWRYERAAFANIVGKFVRRRIGLLKD